MEEIRLSVEAEARVAADRFYIERADGKIRAYAVVSRSDLRVVEIRVLGRPHARGVECEFRFVARKRNVKHSVGRSYADAPSVGAPDVHNDAAAVGLRKYVAYVFMRDGLRPHGLPYARHRSVPHTAAPVLLFSPGEDVAVKVILNAHGQRVFGTQRVGHVKCKRLIAAAVGAEVYAVEINGGCLIRSAEVQQHSAAVGHRRSGKCAAVPEV